MTDPKLTPTEKDLLEEILALIRARDLVGAEKLMRDYLAETEAASTYAKHHRELRRRISEQDQ
jgi:DNA-binding FadR family transcriptional regulator